MHAQIDLTQPTREALIERLRIELREGLHRYWYDDRYSEVPVEVRSARILNDHPALNGHKRQIGALRVALMSAEKRA